MNPDLEATAVEELEQALALRWRDIAPLVPWGDSYVGISIGGREVEFARNYIWAAEPGGDILCEIRVFAGEARYDDGAGVSAIIPRE